MIFLFLLCIQCSGSTADRVAKTADSIITPTTTSDSTKSPNVEIVDDSLPPREEEEGRIGEGQVDEDLDYRTLVIELGGKKTPGWLAFFGPDVTDKVSWKVVIPKDPYGCELADDDRAAGDVLIVKRGGCLFSKKAIHAEVLEAGALIVMNYENSTTPLFMSTNDTSSNFTIPVVGIPYQKDLILEDLQKAAAWPYTPPIVDPSEVILILMATFFVVAGAIFATQDLHKSPLVNRQPEVLVMDAFFALQFVILSSAVLLILYTFMHYAIYFLLAIFCSSGLSLVNVFRPVWTHFFPSSIKKIYTFELQPASEDSEQILFDLTLAHVCVSILAVIIVALFLVFRNDPVGWIFQDLIGFGCLCQIQQTLRLPNIKLATFLLTLLFFYDIFWVFLSPMIFEKSVMVEVAKGGGTGETVPMLLRIPSILDELGTQRMLGFGDIALPGLLISYLLRHDMVAKLSGFSGYFVPSVIAYSIGLIITFIALKIMQKGQPALLYLVPATLGTVIVLGLKRGELSNLWNGFATVNQLTESKASTYKDDVLKEFKSIGNIISRWTGGTTLTPENGCEMTDSLTKSTTTTGPETVGGVLGKSAVEKKEL